MDLLDKLMMDILLQEESIFHYRILARARSYLKMGPEEYQIYRKHFWDDKSSVMEYLMQKQIEEEKIEWQRKYEELVRVSLIFYCPYCDKMVKIQGDDDCCPQCKLVL